MEVDNTFSVGGYNRARELGHHGAQRDVQRHLAFVRRQASIREARKAAKNADADEVNVEPGQVVAKPVSRIPRQRKPVSRLPRNGEHTYWTTIFVKDPKNTERKSWKTIQSLGESVLGPQGQQHCYAFFSAYALPVTLQEHVKALALSLANVREVDFQIFGAQSFGSNT